MAVHSTSISVLWVVRDGVGFWLAVRYADLAWVGADPESYGAVRVVTPSGTCSFVPLGLQAKPVARAERVAALLWSLHPMRVEPVAWATDRPYCLAVLFC